MKDFHCRDAGMSCDFIAKGQSDDEVLGQARSHAEKSHQMSVTTEVETQIRGLIHDESSDAHRMSMMNLV